MTLPANQRLGLGLAALGRPGYINLQHGGDLPDRSLNAMRSHAHAVLDAAFAAGILSFDAARSYGEAERFLRSWLDARRIPPEQVTVGSKWGYVYEANWQVQAKVHERKEHSLAMLERQLQESTSILDGYLRLYQIHSATLESGVLENGPVLDALARLKERGLLIGLTTSGPGQAETLRRAMSIRRGGEPLFGAVQSTWNLLERSAEVALREAKQAGMRVIVKEVLANGRLTPRGGTTSDAIAIAAALAQPWADLVLLGPTTVEQLQSNLKACELRLSSDDWVKLEGMREDPARYWETRARLPWN